jgi:hypothetical protein
MSGRSYGTLGQVARPVNTSAFFITFCVGAAKGCRQQLWYRDIPAQRDFKNGKRARHTLSPGAKGRFRKVIQGASDSHLPVAMAGVCSPILAE